MADAPGDKTSGAAIGAIIAGRYEIVAQLGAGGMGAVYQARQLSMERLVALKLIHPHLAARHDLARRFEREMEAAAKIEHPNTIRVLDYGVAEDGQLFVAMELVDGRSLAALLKELGALPLPRLLHIAAQVVRALGAAHERGIAHGDLKPDHVLLLDRHGERDIVKVLDFGVGRLVDGDETRAPVSGAGALAGSAAYRSPEQALGQPVDARADFYALGVMLFEMATGQLPFTRPTLPGLRAAHAHDAPPLPSSIAPVTPALEALIVRLLAKEPAQRPASAAELLALVEGCRPGARAPAPAATGATAPDRSSAAAERAAPATARRGRGARWPLALAALALAGGAVVVAITATRHARQRAAVVAARARLTELAAADGEPQLPSECRAFDGAEVERLARAATLLSGSSIGAPRPQDRQALALLTAGPEPGVTPPAGEPWTLRAQARLVVEPTADGALADARRAAAACPEYAVAHQLVGNAEQRLGHPDAARAAYERALTIEPSYLAPRFQLGLLALRAGDAASALGAFDAVLVTEPHHPRAHLVRGQAHLMLGHIASALADLEVYTRRHPDDAEGWFLLGQARARSSAPETARAAWCQAKALGSVDGARLCP